MKTKEFLRTAQDVVHWIEANVKPESCGEKRWTRKALRDAVCWWVAVQEAHQVHELSTKDMARMLLGGCKPITFRYAQNFIDTVWEDAGKEAEFGPRDWMLQSLCQHFDVKGG